MWGGVPRSRSQSSRDESAARIARWVASTNTVEAARGDADGAPPPSAPEYMQPSVPAVAIVEPRAASIAWRGTTHGGCECRSSRQRPPTHPFHHQRRSSAGDAHSPTRARQSTPSSRRLPTRALVLTTLRPIGASGPSTSLVRLAQSVSLLHRRRSSSTHTLAWRRLSATPTSASGLLKVALPTLILMRSSRPARTSNVHVFPPQTLRRHRSPCCASCRARSRSMWKRSCSMRRDPTSSRSIWCCTA